MNFNNIIIQGITNNDNKSNLKSYFIREFRKAERDNFYNIDDFFNPLFRKVDSLKNELNEKFIKTEKAYKSIIQKAKINGHNFHDHYLTHCLDKQGISYEHFKEQENKKWLADTTKKLAEFEINKIYTKVHFTQINFAHVLLIENGLNVAKMEIEKLKNINNTNQKTEVLKPFNVDSWKFSSSFYIMTDEEFKATIYRRYGQSYTDEQLNQVIEKFKMENTPVKKQEAQEKLSAKAYIEGGSLYSYGGFKKSMLDSTDNGYYLKLENTWSEAQKKYISENGLQEVSKGLELLFSSYLSKIFTIYKHAFKYHENNSIKDLKQIALKRARFDCLVNEQTDYFIANLKSEKVKGNYKLILDRKDYVLGLFTNMETFLKNASINFSKSPFEEIFTTSKDKIQNCISFEEIKFLATHTKQNTFSEEQKRLKIAFEIVGENNSRTTSIMYHHIPSVLERYSLNNIEAKNILLTASGGFHPDTQNIIIPKIIDFLKEVKINSNKANNDLSVLPETFEELFYNAKDAEVCLNILRDLDPKVIDGLNNYIGKAKGIFPLWVQVLKTFNSQPLIKHFPDKVYKDLLNKKIKGLNLSKDASEFRKTYKRLINNNVDLDIKTILSQYSQDGKLGK